MTPLLLQSVAPAESPWVPSSGSKGLRFRGAGPDDWFKAILISGGETKTLDLNGPRRKVNGRMLEFYDLFFNGVVPDRVKIIFIQGSGPVDVDLI